MGLHVRYALHLPNLDHCTRPLSDLHFPQVSMHSVIWDAQSMKQTLISHTTCVRCCGFCQISRHPLSLHGSAAATAHDLVKCRCTQAPNSMTRSLGRMYIEHIFISDMGKWYCGKALLFFRIPSHGTACREMISPPLLPRLLFLFGHRQWTPETILQQYPHTFQMIPPFCG